MHFDILTSTEQKTEESLNSRDEYLKYLGVILWLPPNIGKFPTYELVCRARSKRDGTRAETRFGLSAKRTSPLKSAGVSVQSAAGSRCVRISGSNAG